MSYSTHTTPSGFLLPSIHAAQAFYTKQRNQQTQAIFTENWSRLILAYARHKRLFTLRLEDAETSGNPWDEIFRNTRINRRLFPNHLSHILQDMVSKNLAVYDPPKQTSSVLLFWRTPEEWADVLYEWADSTGLMNSILTFYDITEPVVPSQLSDIPVAILRRAINVLVKVNRAQLIAVADGEGVRFLAQTGR
ncbi:ESCRT-II complex vps25 subunit [Cristinia sonorae]|uniref:ESCRT-II complex vps25 subunit n=1 Tax=Cristinia sonorae TaxID=1940300 RepID=A0A8K0UQM3_9AGAR|nr:ESCRT-II complex vps25 subunit [Cristinia sonorae]